MAQILVRNLEDDVKQRITNRARLHGHSTEEEVREILRRAVLVDSTPGPCLGSRLAERFAEFDLTEDIPELRGGEPVPADFES